MMTNLLFVTLFIFKNYEIFTYKYHTFVPEEI